MVDNNHNERLGELRVKVEHLERQVSELDRKLDELVEMAHRWKGAFALVLGFGSLIGWLLSIIPSLKR